MAWRGWYRTRVRKPLPVFCVLFTFGVIVWYMHINEDIPTNMMYLLEAIDGDSVGGYMGSSAYESRYGDGWNSCAPQAPEYTDYDKEETH